MKVSQPAPPIVFVVTRAQMRSTSETGLKKKAAWRCQDTVINQLLELMKVLWELGLTLINRGPWGAFRFRRVLRSI